MRASTTMLFGLALLVAGSARADEAGWKPVTAAPRVKLGRPQPLQTQTFTTAQYFQPSSPAYVQPVKLGPIFRGQSPDPFPPPPPPPPGAMLPGAPAPTLGAEEAYNCGVVNTPGKTGGWWERFCDSSKQCCDDVFGSFKGAFAGGASRKPFQSDHEFDEMISPVSQPFTFEDPRALTELRPIFIYQHTPSSNQVFSGGNNFFAGLQGRLAVTERVSVVVNKLGWDWIDPVNPAMNPAFTSGNGFAELWVGPKVTLIRNQDTRSVVAAGLTVEIPIGSGTTFQSTGNLGLTPYLSWAQNFAKSSYGSFNFIANGGYTFALDSERNQFAFANLHLDYDILNLKKFYPLIELNYAYYTSNGSTAANFGGWDLYNFGSNAVSGLNELVVNVGGRYKFSENWQFGLAAGWNVLGGSRHLDSFRLTVDMIIRY